MANKRAMVIGCKGMDGSHICDLLESKDYEVWGIGRDESPHNIRRYAKQVNEIYNFAGKSDVINPFENVYDLEDVYKIPLIVLEEIKGTQVKFFQAGSPLMLNPDTPYGAAKAHADVLIKMYRDKFNCFAVTGILYPHTSERQKDHFFGKKIIKAAATKTKIEVDHLNADIDYGYAPDFVEAAWLMLQGQYPKDYTIAAGRTIMLRHFAGIAFEHVGLYYFDYIKEKDSLYQGYKKYEAPDWSEIYKDFGWAPKTPIETAIKLMIDNYAKTL